MSAFILFYLMLVIINTGVYKTKNILDRKVINTGVYKTKNILGRKVCIIVCLHNN